MAKAAEEKTAPDTSGNFAATGAGKGFFNIDAVEVPAKYDPAKDRAEFMNPVMKAYFGRQLRLELQEAETERKAIKKDIETNRQTDPVKDFADGGSRTESDNERQRRADRLRKRIDKLRKVLHLLQNPTNDAEYGYCMETAEPIEIERLKAHPATRLCLEAQEEHERQERVHRNGRHI